MFSRKTNPKVSVLMPAYNAQDFIDLSIKSVLMQDYDDFELIIVDDGSIDNTLGIITKHKGNPHLRYYTQKHKGIPATRNRLIGLARGEYISPHDADDIMLKGKLKVQVHYLDSHPEVGVIYGNAFVMDKNNKLSFSIPSPYKEMPTIPDIPHCSSMIRKSEILKIGCYNENILNGTEDTDMWRRLRDVTKFKYVNHFFYVYRRHHDSIIYRLRYLKYKEDFL